MAEEMQVADPGVVELTQTRVDDLAEALKGQAYVYSFEESVTVETAKQLVVIQDHDDYQRGLDLMESLADMEKRVTTWYGRFDKPLNFLINVVRDLKRPQMQELEPERKRIGGLLGAWKAAEERRERIERERVQAALEAAARAEAEAKAKALEDLAAQEAASNPVLAQTFAAEAQAVRESPVTPMSAPDTPSATRRSGSFSKTAWACEFVDLKALLLAYVEGRCFLDEEAIKEALQPSLDKQAAALGPMFAKAYPGTRAVTKPYVGVRRRRS